MSHKHAQEVMHTRGQKRKRKEELLLELRSPLWRLITEQRDVFVKCVLPKLNETDRYFFANANDESWNVLEYAGVNVLELGFRAQECSSISMLEWVWNVIDRGKHSQVLFCAQVAGRNKLEFLKWAREEKKCDWDDKTSEMAAYYGNLEMLKYCVDNGCPLRKDICAIVARNGHLNLLKFLIDEKKLAYDEKQVMGNAGCGGNLDMLKYLIEDKKHTNPMSQILAFRETIRFGHLDCVKYFVEEVKISEALRSWYAIDYARYFEQHEVLNYLREKNFTEPTEEEYAEFVATQHQ